MSRKIDLVGKKYGRLLVIGEGASKNGKVYWLCKCECGINKEVIGRDLKKGATKSCGCLRNEFIKKLNRTHGMTSTSEYNIWSLMNKRCTNENDIEYNNYGGRGIKVCDRWKNSFENFFSDMGPRPSLGHSLDRFPNNEDGNYERSNCRWGTAGQQTRNRRSNVWFEYLGVKMVVKDWADKFGVNHGAISYRINKGESFEQVYHHFNNKMKCHQSL